MSAGDESAIDSEVRPPRSFSLSSPFGFFSTLRFFLFSLAYLSFSSKELPSLSENEQILVDMGFELGAVREALGRSENNVDRAIDLLFS